MVRRSLFALSLAAALASPAFAFRNLAAGQQVGAVALPGLDGAPQQVGAAPGGQATLVLFWATWSPRSLAALADFEGLHRDYGAHGLRVVAVNVEGEKTTAQDEARVSAAAAAAGVSYAVALDRELAVYAAWGVGAVPSAVLVDGAGKVLETLDGYPPNLRRQLARLVTGALGHPETQQAAADGDPTSLAQRAAEPVAEATR